MALLGNNGLFFKNPIRAMGGEASKVRSNFNTPGASRNLFAGQGITNQRAAVPNGYRPPYSWIVPRIAGGLASYTLLTNRGDVTFGNLAGGRNGQATIANVGDITNAEGQLIAGIVATLSGSGDFATAPTLAAILYAAATLTGTSNLDGGTLGALVELVAALQGLGTFDGSMTAKANLSAAITPFTTLSPENLARAVWAESMTDYNTANTFGKQLRDGGGSGPTAAQIADAVWDELKAGHTTAESMGKILQDLEVELQKRLKKTDFIALK